MQAHTDNFLSDVTKVGKRVAGAFESTALKAARKVGLRSATTTAAPAPPSGLLQALMDRGLCHGLHESVWLSLMSVFSALSLLLVLWGSVYSLFHTVSLKSESVVVRQRSSLRALVCH